jgi:dTDP-4-dehydrorhamnose 3,5-epimerase
MDMIRYEKMSIPEVVVITPVKHRDGRGFFMETFRQDDFETHVGPFRFVQDNQSFSAPKGPIRGLHFQTEPHAQGKLISCTAGAIWDVAVDIRPDSSSYGSYVSVELSAENGKQLWVPPGFAHGFCTLEENTGVCYKVTAYFSPAHDRGTAFDDPDLEIPWPVDLESAKLSPKDRQHAFLRNQPDGLSMRLIP